jgi:hypothetical protein
VLSASESAATQNEMIGEMLKVLISASLATAGLLGSTSAASGAGRISTVTDPVLGAPKASQGSLLASRDDGRGTDYILDNRDSICGLADPRQLTRPARVDHGKLIALTSPMQRMKREKINPASAKGIQLRTEAAKMVSRACEKVRNDKKYCSVWKKIRSRDGKKIADITTLVKRQLGS